MIEDLRLFLSICDSGSLSAAARQARLNPSTVSRRMAALEENFGTKLLSKSTRRLALTSAGRTLASGSRVVVEQFDAMRAALAEAENAPSGQLRISASTGFGGRYVAPLIGDFRRRYPAIDIDLQLDNSIVDLVANDADVAIRVGELPSSQLRHISLGSIHRIACASPDYLRDRLQPQQPADLRDHECINVTAGGRSPSNWRFRGGNFQKVNARVVVNSHEAAAAAAKSGAGIAYLPFWLVRDELLRGELVRLLANFDAPDAGGVHLLWHERPPSRVRAFIDFVRERIRPGDLAPAAEKI